MISLAVAAWTDTGRMREENEDCVWSQVYSTSSSVPTGLFIVCDGMGGHMGGRYASYWAVEAVKSEFADLFVAKDPRATLLLTDADIEKVRRGELINPKPPEEPDIEALTTLAIQKANHVVYQYAAHKPERAANAGTTVTMMVVHGTQAVISNVGDSRAYLLRDHELIQITRDHSVVASLVAEGYILPEETYTHPQRNVIYRYLGQRGMVQPDIFREEVRSGDCFLLCSDGLWELVRSSEKLVKLLENTQDSLQACQDLIDAANAAGGDDNISVVVVRAN
jgi:serine/threonine protein phosphatase PrpC